MTNPETLRWFQARLDEQEAHLPGWSTVVFPLVLLGGRPNVHVFRRLHQLYGRMHFDKLHLDTWPLVMCRVTNEDCTEKTMGQVLLKWYTRN